jgi:hypothetical protein
MLANNCVGPTDKPDEPGDNLRANPSDDSGASSSEPKAIAKVKAKDSFGRRMTLVDLEGKGKRKRVFTSGKGHGRRTNPKTDAATSFYAVNATVTNTLRQDALKDAKELAKAQAQVHSAAWATNVKPNSTCGSQAAEIGRAVGLPWSDNDLMFESPRPTSTPSFFAYRRTCGRHFPPNVSFGLGAVPWRQRFLIPRLLEPY